MISTERSNTTREILPEKDNKNDRWYLKARIQPSGTCTGKQYRAVISKRQLLAPQQTAKYRPWSGERVSDLGDGSISPLPTSKPHSLTVTYIWYFYNIDLPLELLNLSQRFYPTSDGGKTLTIMWIKPWKTLLQIFGNYHQKGSMKTPDLLLQNQTRNYFFFFFWNARCISC